MKYLKYVLLVVVAIIIVGFIGAIVALNSDSVHRNVEAKLAAATGFDVHLGRFGWAFPLRLSVGRSELKSTSAEVEWDEASATVSRFIPPFGVDVRLDHPRLTIPDAGESAPAPKPTPAPDDHANGGEPKGGAAAAPPMKISLRVRDGEVTTSSARVTGLDVDFAQGELLRSPASLRLDALVKAGPLPAPVPIHLETDSLTLTPTKVTATKIDARVAGIVAEVAGESDLAADRHAWQLHADAPDLKKVPVPSADVKTWVGAVKAEVKVAKVGAKIDADGVVSAVEVRADLNAKRAGADLTGPVTVNVDAQFGFHGGVLDLPRATLGLDAGAVAIAYGDVFRKPSATPLSGALEIKGTATQLNVTRLDARLGDLRLTGGGRAATAAPFNGRVDLNVAPVTLASLRPLLPSLAKVPAEGSVAFKGAVEGPLGLVNKIRVQIDRASLDGPLGALAVTGKVGEVTAAKGPRLDVVVTTSPLKLGAARTLVPALKDLVPDGEVRARVTLNGVAALSKPWPEWPLDVGGEVAAKIPEYTLVEAKPASATKVPPGKDAPATAPAGPAAGFLPKGYLTEHVRLRLVGEVASVRKGTLVIKGVKAQGEVANARFRGSAGVGQIFDGKVSATGLDVPLVEPRPAISGEVTWSGLVIEKAVLFAKPEFKDFATGLTSGRAKFRTRLPEDPEFLNTLEAAGSATAQPVTLNSVKIGEIINSSVGKIPGLNIPPVKVTPLHGLVTADYAVRGGTADLPAVLARDADGSELNVKGRVRLRDLNGDLSGTFAWANSPIKGCAAEANSDGHGRIVIPLAIKGNLMDPGFAVVGDMITKFGARTAECEGKKLLGRAQKEGLEGLKKEGGKLLKGLFGH